MTNRHPITAIIVILVLAGLSFWSIYLVRPPKAVPVNAPTTEFSAGRAMLQLRQIAKEPHAMGTPGHATVRNYLIDQLNQLGLQTQVQDTTVSNQSWGSVTTGHVYNIVGRLKGNARGKAVLLMAHYDSQPNTPGAADDGAGVAAILETVRALRQGPTLRNDLIVLLTDGEEYGLFGATAFMLHPWAKEVGFVINLEARGNGGPSMTFEISPENGWVVEAFAKAAPTPFASSLMYEVYRALPNDTDFTVFRKAGYSGVNSAFIDGFVNYHKMTDTPDNIDQNSLQHHGNNMLALARHVGNLSLNNTKAPDKSFFNPAGSWLVQYPISFNIGLVIVLALLLGATFVIGLRKKVISIGQSIGGFFLFLLLLITIAGGFYLINLLVTHFLPYSHTMNGVYGSSAFFVGYLLGAIGLFLLITRFFIQWIRPFSLLMSVYLLLFILTLTLAILVPSSPYVFLFPLLFSLTGTLIVFWFNLYRQITGFPYIIVKILTLLPAIFILMPLVSLLFVTFSLQLPMASMTVLMLVLGLCVPLLVGADLSLQWRQVPLFPALLLLAGIAQTIVAINAEKPSAERPLHSHVSYFLNADTKQAFWASYFQTTDDWNQQFFPSPTTGALSEIYPTAKTRYLKNKADVIDVPPPVAELLSETTTGNERTLTIKLRSPRGAAHLDIILQPTNERDWLGATLNGESIADESRDADTGKSHDVLLNGLPTTKDALLVVRLKAGGSLRLFLYDQSIGLPGQLVKIPRPAHVIPEQGRNSNLTVVGKMYRF